MTFSEEERLRTCCFTGHRPEKCHLSEREIRIRLKEEILKAVSKGYTDFISGMAPGVDAWAAAEVLTLRNEGHQLRLICALPYPGFPSKGTETERQWCAKIIREADVKEVICPRYLPGCFLARDRWMVDRSSLVIAVFNGSGGGTAFTVNYANECGREVTVIEDR